jgi:hypothetical protein
MFQEEWRVGGWKLPMKLAHSEMTDQKSQLVKQWIREDGIGTARPSWLWDLRTQCDDVTSIMKATGPHRMFWSAQVDTQSSEVNPALLILTDRISPRSIKTSDQNKFSEPVYKRIHRLWVSGLLLFAVSWLYLPAFMRNMLAPSSRLKWGLRC